MEESPVQLAFDGGTLLISGGTEELLRRVARRGLRSPHCALECAEARHYRDIVEFLRSRKIPYEDSARGYAPEPSGWKLHTDRVPFWYQDEALEVWWKTRGRGVVALPTGTGKTFVAMMAMVKVSRPTLVVTPTIDLLNQWHDQLFAFLKVPIGMIGGNSYELQPITVTTYQSAHNHLERLGNLFGLLVFDECHHLPGPSYGLAASGSIAPYRLGLTATPELADGGEIVYPALIGPIVYRREIQELSGQYLAGYQTLRILVSLSPEEQDRYVRARELYRRFLSEKGISISSPSGWQRFLYEAGKTEQGAEAYRAYREQKQLELRPPGQDGKTRRPALEAYRGPDRHLHC